MGTCDYTKEEIELGAWKPHPDNPRRHPKPGSPRWEVLKKALLLLNWDPIKVNRRNGMIISGHLRWKILLEMGERVATALVYDLDETTHKQMLVAANVLLGEFEDQGLARLAKELTEQGIETGLMALTENQLATLIEGPTTVPENVDAAELLHDVDRIHAKWEARLGDMWQIGPHRLLCGDCSLDDNWQRLLEGRSADAGWIDPPYNVDVHGLEKHVAKRRKGTKTGARSRPMLNDKMSDAKYAAILRQWLDSAARHLKPGGVLYVAHADKYRLETESAARAAGFYVSQNLVWVKNAFTLGRSDHKNAHEPILYMWKEGAKHYWQGGYSKATVLEEAASLKSKSKAELIAIIDQLRNDAATTVTRHPRSVSNELHPTIKPLKLVAEQLWNSSRPGDTVIELFGGSGTSIAAAHQIGRTCFATELDPPNCSIILERMSAYGLPIEKVHGLQ